MVEESVPVLPKHIGFIIDGNRRWAKKHGLPVYEGHLAGYNAIKEVGLATLAAGVKYMSVYVFSTENWKRSADEVGRLMGLVLKLLYSDVPEFNKNNVRLKVVGSKDNLDPKIITAIANAEAETASNTGGELLVCFNYGGRAEIVDAVKSALAEGMSADDLTEDVITQHLYEPNVPPLDLVVRTSGEQRLSNFMLWRAAYSEMMFIKKNWPDMTKDDVAVIMKEYAKRQRRFGS